MKRLQLLGLIVGMFLCVGCESTKSSGEGNQEEKRRAAIAQHQNNQMDESERNLHNSQRDRINRDGNPSRNYY